MHYPYLVASEPMLAEKIGGLGTGLRLLQDGD
jgi:hypothetical protein